MGQLGKVGWGNGVWGEGGIGSLYYINIELTLSDKGSLMT